MSDDHEPTDANAPTLLSKDMVESEQSRLALPAEPLAGELLASRYELERVLGQGGMGTVWKGKHLGLGIPVAVKTLRHEVASRADYARRFRREAHAASLLNHPNVVRVLDFGDHAGVLYMVMEYLVGRSLADVIASERSVLPLAEVTRVMSALCDACALAHSFGIVHRDLKPDNVFLTAPDGTVKVVDFGLAHVDDARDQGPTLTSSDVVAGTPEYMSPEQCRSLAVGPSTDLYALGCILTCMLQRRPPFAGGSSIELLAKQMFAQPPALVRPADAEPVPPLLDRLRTDLLAKAPEQRPRDPAEVKARLVEAMSEEATAARLPTRKGDEPLGDRASRAQGFQPAHGDANTSASAQTSVGVRPPHDRRYALLLRLGEVPGGVDGELETGMASLGIDLARVTTIDEIRPHVAAIVLDGAEDAEGTLRVLAQIRTRAPEAPVLVCAADIGTGVMNALVAAGASDVLRYPVTSDKLGRKLSRLLRHRR